MVADLRTAFVTRHARGGSLSRFVDPAQMEVMWCIKAALDPLGILNPGVIPD